VAATIPDSPDRMGIWAPDGRIVNYVYSAGIRDWAGWLDDQHVLAGSYLVPTFQPVARLSAAIRSRRRASAFMCVPSGSACSPSGRRSPALAAR
jgi:hypothetical protein